MTEKKKSTWKLRLTVILVEFLIVAAYVGAVLYAISEGMSGNIVGMVKSVPIIYIVFVAIILAWGLILLIVDSLRAHFKWLGIINLIWGGFCLYYYVLAPILIM